MKLGLYFNNSLYLLLLFFALGACKKETLRVSENTEEWLQTKTDTKLHFTSHTGDTEEITVTVEKDVATYPGTYDKKYEYYRLTYQGMQSDLGLVIVAEDKAIHIRNIGQTNFEGNYVTLTTGKKQTDEVVNPYGVEAELVDNLTLNGITYERLLRVTFYLPAYRPDKIKEIYYAKKHGLVYFQTIDGSYWSLD